MKCTWLSIPLLIIALSGGLASAGPTSFTLNKTAALKLGAVEWSDAAWPGGFNLLAPVTDDRWTYQSSGLMQGQVGFYGHLDDTDGDSFASVRIGASGYPGGVDAVLMTHDLSTYASYDLIVANDNDDVWSVKLYVRTSSSYRESSAWTTIGAGTSSAGSLDLSGLSDLDAVTDIGLLIGGALTGLGGNPSDPDVFHISVAPVASAPGPGVVPVPGALALALSGLAWLGAVRHGGRGQIIRIGSRGGKRLI